MLSNFPNEQILWEGAGNSRLLNMVEFTALGALLLIKSLDTTPGCPDLDLGVS